MSYHRDNDNENKGELMEYWNEEDLITLFRNYFEKMDFTQEEADNCIDEFNDMSKEESQEFVDHVTERLSRYNIMIPELGSPVLN